MAKKAEIKTRYKHIHFEESAKASKSKNFHPTYFCRNNKSKNLLGIVDWYPDWKKYVFGSGIDAVFDTSCLRDIINFMEQL